MLHSLVDACFIIDTTGVILFQNFAAEDLMGYGTELVGCNVRDLTPPETRSKHDTYLK
jgi:PAS domain S-box-containing protein